MEIHPSDKIGLFDNNLVLSGQLDLRELALFPQALVRTFIIPQINVVLLAESFDAVLNQSFVEITPAQVRVALSPYDINTALGKRNERYI